MASVDYKALKNGGFMRQKQKDNFSLRLKVVGGNLTAEQLVTIANVSKKYGDGHVHLTSRQGVEIPFMKLGDIDTVKSELFDGGVSTGVCGPRVRTVTACQGSQICPSGCIDTYALAVEISERYFGKELPHKFKFGVTGCQNNCLKAEENDLGIKGGYSIRVERGIRLYSFFWGYLWKYDREGQRDFPDSQGQGNPFPGRRRRPGVFRRAREAWGAFSRRGRPGRLGHAQNGAGKSLYVEGLYGKNLYWGGLSCLITSWTRPSTSPTWFAP